MHSHPVNQSSRQTRIIFGGTFDPVQRAHIQVVKDVGKLLHADSISLIPCYIPVHRNKPGADQNHRLAMLKLAVKNSENITIDEREILRQGHSYTIDTLASYREEYPDDCLIFLMGSDSWNQFHTWKDWQKFSEFCHLVVAKRPNYDLKSDSAVTEWSKSKLVSDPSEIMALQCGKIWKTQVSLIPIAATMIRQAIANKQPIEHLTTPEVATYIAQHALYKRGNT